MDPPASLRDTLQQVRKARRVSQLELSLRLGVSQRHVSFVESGRARPSRELLLAWLAELETPLVVRNEAMLQAGYAPAFGAAPLGDPGRRRPPTPNPEYPMTSRSEQSNRRAFVRDLGALALGAPLGLEVVRQSAAAPAPVEPAWDLTWVTRLADATDRATFDWPTMGDPADPMVLQLAGRYLDNCTAVYGPNGFRPGIVLNIRTTATAAALTDALWNRFELGSQTKTNDPDTGTPARRNPFLRRPAAGFPGVPDLAELVGRGAILLACDFALGHLSRRLATAAGRPQDEVLGDLRAGLLPGCHLVPSGIFGLARAQNAGCALIRM